MLRSNSCARSFSLFVISSRPPRSGMQFAQQSRSPRFIVLMQFLPYQILAAFCFFILSIYNVQAEIIPRVLTTGTVGFPYKTEKFSSNTTTQKAVWSAKGLPPGLTFSQIGVLSGVPKWDSKWSIGNATSSRNFTVSFSVKGLSGSKTASNETISIPISIVKTTPPTITTTQLPAGKMDVRYANPGSNIGFILSATGGVPFPVPPKPTGYNWALMTGKLPRGMTFNSVGALSGIPTQQGSFTLKFRATDAVGQFVEKTFTLFIGPPEPPVIITECPLPEGLEKFKYPNVGIYAQNGKKPYKWSISEGTLPTGLVLENTSYSVGFIKGTPTTRGNATTFTLKVTDANGMSATKNCSITIRPAPELIIKPIFKCARVGESACEQIEAFGGDLPYKWEVQGLPPGLSIDPNTGKICGNFTVPGNFTIPITVTEASGNKDTENFTFQVKPALEITTTSLDFGIKGSPYPKKTGTPTAMIEVTGGWPIYSWQLIIGILPPGLQINPNTGAITGTPTKTGTYRFTVRVKDSCEPPAKWVDKEYEIKIYDPLEIITIDPLACATVGFPISTIPLSAKGGLPAYIWTLIDGVIPGIALSQNGTFVGTLAQAGSFPITVRVRDENGITEDKSFIIKVNQQLLITSQCPLAFGTNGTSYSALLSATGGNPSYSWSVLSPSALPTGLALDSSTGQISGTPRVTGNFSFAYKVTDACGNNATANCTINLYEPLNIPTSSLFSCVWVGDDAECFQVQATGGAPTYTWDALNLPPALTINATSGKICGNFTQTGNFTSTIRVADQNGTVFEKSFSTQVTAPLEITTACPFPDGNVNQNYNITLAAKGGKPPYTWQVLPQIYVADFNNDKIRKFYEGGIVTTYAGNGITASIDGNLTTSSFNGPYGMAFDIKGNLYVADRTKIRKISNSGNVTTLNGTYSSPEDMLVDDTGIVYVSDSNQNNIKKIDLSGSVTILAGNSIGASGYQDGNGLSAKFYYVQGMSWDLDGNIILTDCSNHRIRKITTAGNATTIAGTGVASYLDGMAVNSMFNLPHDVKIHQDGTIYVLDVGNKCVRKILSNGTVSTLGTRFNLGSTACLSVDKSGFVYVSDVESHTISKISLTGNVTPFAGKTGGGDLDNVSPLEAKFDKPLGIEINPYEDLPLGLTLNSTTGVISGIPKAHGLYNLTYQVTDSCGNKVISNCTLTIASNEPDFNYELPWKFTDTGSIAFGHNGSLRNYTSTSMPAGALWSVSADNLTLKVSWENSANCIGGNNPNNQVATATINMTTTKTQKIGLNWVGIGELQASNYDKMQVYIDNVLIGSANAAGGGQGCKIGPVVSVNNYPLGYSLPAGNHSITIEATTADGLYHTGSFYQFTFKLIE